MFRLDIRYCNHLTVHAISKQLIHHFLYKMQQFYLFFTSIWDFICLFIANRYFIVHLGIHLKQLVLI